MKQNVTVLRVVDKNHQGYRRSPYPSLYNEINANAMIDYTDYEQRRPLIWWEGVPKSYLRAYHRFGFVSNEQFKRWFPENERLVGSALGGLIEIHTINKNYVIETPTQAIFDIRKSNHIDTVPLNHYD